MCVDGSSDESVGAARTHWPVRFTKPFGQSAGSAQTLSCRGLLSGHLAVHTPVPLSGAWSPLQSAPFRCRAWWPPTPSPTMRASTTPKLPWLFFWSVASWIQT